MSSLVCLGRHTVTGLLAASGSAFHDWSAAYRLFAKDRAPVEPLFAGVRRALLPRDVQDLIAVLDDTLLPKSGAKTPGVAWRRDPKGPHFQTNLIRAQRFLQISMAPDPASGLPIVVPVEFCHAPTPPKPGAKATGEQRRDYARLSREMRLSRVAAQRLRALRDGLDQQRHTVPLTVAVDGGYTNATLIKNLPPRTTLVGRIRKDAKLFYQPEAGGTPQGRPRIYGDCAPTPEQLRTGISPWQTITIPHRGKPWEIRYKLLPNLLWRKTGGGMPLQLLVLAPTAYRLHAAGKLLYRQPAFLICTDPAMPVDKMITAYLYRWQIECNFRDEKSLLGVGEAQVRSPNSVASAPAFAVASYALLLLASARAVPHLAAAGWPQPKWRTAAPVSFSVQRAIAQLRSEVWGRGLGLATFSDFALALGKAKLQRAA